MNMTTQKSQYTPVFTPRFYLPNSTVVGMEVNVKYGQRILTATEALRLVQSGNATSVLNQIKRQQNKWQAMVESEIYISWKLCGRTNQSDFMQFLDEIGKVLPFSQLELLIDCHDLKEDTALIQAMKLFDSLPNERIRKGLFHSRPLELCLDGLFGRIDVLKLRQGVIREAQEGLAIATQCHEVIERLVKNNIEIVVDDLYAKLDVTCAILIGAKYGQGFYLSRNQIPQKSVKTLKKKPDSDFYERRIDFFRDFAWG